MKWLRQAAGVILIEERQSLLESRGNGGKLRVQVGAHARDGGDDRNRDEAGEEAVFNGRNASLVLHKTGNNILHRFSSLGSCVVSEYDGTALNRGHD